MLRCKAAFHIIGRHRKQPSSMKKKLDVDEPKDPHVHDVFNGCITRILEELPQNDNNPDAAWSTSRDTVCNTAKSVLGHPTRKH